MSSNFILWTLGTAGVIAFVIVVTIQNIKKKLLQTVSELKENKPLFSNSELGNNLNSYVKALSNDDKNRFLLLEKLKNNPTSCLNEFTEAFEKLSEGNYNTKWMIVYCISQFELPQFVKLLSRIAHFEIPNEKSENIHLFSTVSEETVIRLRCIEGLKDIAKNGFKEAETELFDLLRSKYLTLNIAACQSLMSVNVQNETEILEILPKDKHYIINIKQRDVKEIAVIKTPEKYITNTDKRNIPIPKPHTDKNDTVDHSRIINNLKSPKINHSQN